MPRTASLFSPPFPSFHQDAGAGVWNHGAALPPRRVENRVGPEVREFASSTDEVELCANSNRRPNAQVCPGPRGERGSASSYQPLGAERTGPPAHPPVRRRQLQRPCQGPREPVLTARGACGSLCQARALGADSGRSGGPGYLTLLPRSSTRPSLTGKRAACLS